jgi:hypothetical protein
LIFSTILKFNSLRMSREHTRLLIARWKDRKITGDLTSCRSFQLTRSHGVDASPNLVFQAIIAEATYQLTVFLWMFLIYWRPGVSESPLTTYKLLGWYWILDATFRPPNRQQGLGEWTEWGWGKVMGRPKKKSIKIRLYPGVIYYYGENLLDTNSNTADWKMCKVQSLCVKLCKHLAKLEENCRCIRKCYPCVTPHRLCQWFRTSPEWTNRQREYDTPRRRVK